jgi:hypothetical protein
MLCFLILFSLPGSYAKLIPPNDSATSASSLFSHIVCQEKNLRSLPVKLDGSEALFSIRDLKFQALE